jgi:multisubunit Na+/H+ antiporter MnhB subunit
VAGLDFVERWSPSRIVLAIAMVVTLAIAAALLWILLGVSPEFLQSGFNGAGERVASGCLIGVFTLLTGLLVFSGWIIVSWLVE